MSYGGARRSVGLLYLTTVLALGCGARTTGGGAAAGTESTTGTGDASSSADAGSSDGDTAPAPGTQATSTGADSGQGTTTGTGDGSSSSDTGSSDGSTASTETERPAGCVCITDEDGSGFQVPMMPTCGEQLCAAAIVQQPEGSVDPELIDPEAVDCGLAALRDRTPGLLLWERSWYEEMMDWEGYILINEDGSIVGRSWGWIDISYDCSDAELGELEPPEHYDSCLLEPDPLLRFYCLRTTPAAVLAVCDEGWWDADG